MIATVKRVLETAVISSIVFLALNNSKRNIPTDLRDAVRDNGAIAQASDTSLKDLKPTPAAVAVPKIQPASDWAAYVKDTEGDKDVFVSKIYSGKQQAQEAMSVAATGLQAKGKQILFSALLKETAGGSFYVIRLDNSVVAVPLGSAISSKKDAAYVNTVKKADDSIENNCREILE